MWDVPAYSGDGWKGDSEMTREEAIRILDPETTGEALAEIEYYNGFSGKTAAVQAVSDACVLAVAALREQEERRWIPVNERFPDKEFWEHNKLYENEDLEVQVIIKGAKMATTLLYNAEGEFYSMDADGETFYVVTHWMPMPEPPKEDAT